MHLAIDIGNVLCHVDLNLIVEKLSRSLNISKEEALWFLTRIQKAHDLGLTTISDELVDRFKIKSELIVSDIIASWNTCIVPNQLVLNKLMELKYQRGLQIAILSNIGFEHKKNLFDILLPRHQNLIKDSVTHFSCDAGCRKPSLLYYQSFLQQYPDFNGCTYVDDLSENLDASKKFGFKTFKFDLNDYYEQNRRFKLGYESNDELNKKLFELEKIIFE